MSLSLSIVIPAYNEAARLGETLRIVFGYLNKHAPDSEVIVVDDGSSDHTPEVAEESFVEAGAVQAQVIRVSPNHGKGFVVRKGLLAARAPVALFSDADLSTPITEAPKLIAPIERGEYDLTFGSRALDRGLIGVHQPWRREQGGRVFNLIVRLATGLPFWDTQCGFKAFRMSVCRPIIEAANIDRFGFDVELIYLAFLAELSLREIPVRWDHYEGSKLSVARDSWRMFNEVRLIRRQARAGVYDEAIAAARVGAKDRERALHTSGAPPSKGDSSSEFASAFKADAGD
ncbi:MAG TPA: dolichyl-phosphate beta-glucosyltransferase [Pyrinomonadaceae bacterium]|nr:dolichyl-phosphate beta-glucosyltransferase [Pyrinomonadaceae bacterium]